MIIGDLNVLGFAVDPTKTKSPLIVDADAMLPFAITGQFLQVIPRRNAQVFERLGRIEHCKLTEGSTLQVPRESLDPFALEKAFRVLVGETPDHRIIVAPRVTNVNRFPFAACLSLPIRHNSFLTLIHDPNGRISSCSFVAYLCS